ncbi:MAG: aldehyde dehydrogenase family protein, partial [Acidimicrobiia bacterium]|nr:aldehyde dehydrogenase family protein [Acidimicrobiia bacterium]
MTRDEIFSALGLDDVNSGAFAGKWLDAAGPELTVENPATAETIATVRMADETDYERIVANSQETFAEWRMVPAPARGDYVRQIGNALRDNK